MLPRKSFCASLFALLTFLTNAEASPLRVYDLKGITRAPLLLDSWAFGFKENRNHQLQINWNGASLIYNSGANANSFADDFISIEGSVMACVGAAGSDCFGDGPFRENPTQRAKPIPQINRQGIFVGAGEFELVNVRFAVDADRSSEADGVFAQADKDIGYLQLLDQPQVGKKASKLSLGLKEHPDLQYAFRLFEDDMNADGFLQIYTWLQVRGWLIAGGSRAETRRGEAVFNGDLLACLQSSTGCGSVPPSNEVPEPSSAVLIGIGALAAWRKQRSKE